MKPYVTTLFSKKVFFVVVMALAAGSFVHAATISMDLPHTVGITGDFADVESLTVRVGDTPEVYTQSFPVTVPTTGGVNELKYDLSEFGIKRITADSVTKTITITFGPITVTDPDTGEQVVIEGGRHTFPYTKTGGVVTQTKYLALFYTMKGESTERQHPTVHELEVE